MPKYHDLRPNNFHTSVRDWINQALWYFSYQEEKQECAFYPFLWMMRSIAIKQTLDANWSRAYWYRHFVTLSTSQAFLKLAKVVNRLQFWKLSQDDSNFNGIIAVYNKYRWRSNRTLPRSRCSWPINFVVRNHKPPKNRRNLIDNTLK